ncbi:MAG: methyltransferase domain-containing protein [Rhodanobacter sp.]
MFTWFECAEDFMPVAAGLRDEVETAERYLAARRSWRGYCVCCRAVVRMRVKMGARFGRVPNLREGMVCRRCKMSNRKRLLWQAIVETTGMQPDVRIALLEAHSPLGRQLALRYPHLVESEFLGEDHVAGQIYNHRGRPVRHESLLGLSWVDAALDLIAHTDVLEHVEHHCAALAECHRVLEPGGQLVFTMPFFMFSANNLLRGRTRDDGSVEHLQLPEYHGDGLRAEGIYTWHHFGWQLLADLRAAGFCKVQIGLDYDPFAGFVSTHHPQYEVGVMLPVVFRATR